MRVELTAEAERDLEAIADWIARNDPVRAATFVRELVDRCLALARFPERFPLVHRYERHAVRHHLHGNYLIFCRVEPHRVPVLHVLHGARDYVPLLFDE